MASLGFSQHQVLGQHQTLRMTPQLRQGIELLNCNLMEMVETIREQLAENPLLEEVPGQEGYTVSQEDMKREEGQRQSEAEQNEQRNGSEESEVDWKQVLNHDSPTAFQSGAGGGMDELPRIEDTTASSETLEQHLLWQLQMQHCHDDERRAGEVMLMNLDERGYLAMTFEEVAEAAGVDMDFVEGAQEIIQGLDPQGCASRTLEECLIYQARRKWPEDPFMIEIIQRHLGDFERRQYNRVASSMKLELEDVVEYHRMIRDELVPHPSRGFADARPEYITPDVRVFKVGEEWVIDLNDDGLPKLRTSDYYRKVLNGAGSRSDQGYIKDKLKAAQALLESIYRRQDTIRRVVQSILTRQEGFFEHGPAHLKPMILRDVADEINVHESTVSRATSRKYIDTPQGIFELKYFFSSGVEQADGSDISAVAIKNRISALVAEENPQKPLSDADIEGILKREGVACARRTVAKYREALNILPSNRRKRMF